MRFIVNDLSFRQTSINITDIKTIALPQIGSLNDTSVANYARIVCAVNFQFISTILHRCWAFSLAYDSSTHYGKSYLDNRIRVHYNGELYNLHAIAISLYVNHNEENMFNLIVRFLNVLCSDWRHKLIGIESDEASVMTGEYQGVVTRLQKSAHYSVYRTWCELHQLDLIMQREYESLMNEDVMTIMYTFNGYLHAQISQIQPFANESRTWSWRCSQPVQDSLIAEWSWELYQIGFSSIE